LNYKKSFGKKVSLSVLAGVTYDAYKFLNKITDGTNFQNLLLRTNGMHFASVVTPYQPIQSDYQLLSYLSRVSLSFLNDRFLLTGNIRADGSSKFAADNRWAYFPSLAVAWRMEKESFIKNIGWVDQLKLRLSYGKTGNQSIDPYSTISSYTQGTYYANNAGDRVLAVNLAGLANTNIKWETTSSYNAGVDFALLKSRLSGTVEAYYKETNDLLISRDIAPSTSFSKVMLNQGALSNKGLEFSLSADVIRKKDVVLNVSGNISFNQSKIIKLGLPQGQFGNSTYVAYLGNSIGDHFGVANIFIQGQAPGLFWGYKTNGIYQGKGDTANVKKSLTNVAPRPGDIKFADLNSDSVINSSDMTVIGNPNPKFIYGFNISATIKSFTISAAFNGSYGNQIFNANLRYQATPSAQSSNLRSDAFENSWRSDKPSNLYPSVTYKLPSVAMDRYVEDGSFLRWSDLTVSYSLPKKFIGKIGLQNANVYTTCKNVALITKYSGFDPEVNSFAFDGLRRGIDLNSFPNARTYILGLNIAF
jgi:TonB-linked SusC/RagA family outer membrane protein